MSIRRDPNLTPAERDRRVRKVYRYKTACGIPTSLLDAAPYRRHLERVVGLGWTLNSLESLGDTSHQTFRLLLKDRHPTIERKTAAAVAALPYSYQVPDAMPAEAFVPTEGATRRVRALLALGWTRADVQAAVTALDPTINVSHVGSGTYPRIRADKWRAVAAVYDQLHMTVGPSTIGRTRARKAGHQPPLAWDDIDDPAETPTGWEYRPASRLELLTDLVERGAGISEATRVLKVTRTSLEKWCERNACRDLYVALTSREAVMQEWHNQWTAAS